MLVAKYVKVSFRTGTQPFLFTCHVGNSLRDCKFKSLHAIWSPLAPSDLLQRYLSNNKQLRCRGRKFPLSMSVLGIGKVLEIACRSSASICHACRTRAKNSQENISAENASSLKNFLPEAPTSRPSELSTLGTSEQRILLATGPKRRSYRDSGISCRPFAGFTRFRRAGISINNAVHTGVCVPGTGRNAWELHWVFTRELPELGVPARW